MGKHHETGKKVCLSLLWHWMERKMLHAHKDLGSQARTSGREIFSEGTYEEPRPHGIGTEKSLLKLR